MRSLGLRIFISVLQKGMILIIREIRCEMRTNAAYEIYSACMYLPTPEKYAARIDAYLSDPTVRCFGANDGECLTSILIVRSGEILGVAVHERWRGRGVGRAMILHALKFFPVLTAETDGDSVGFYRRCGFECTPFERDFPNGSCVRYRCERNA